jgi:hypothetical protein
MVRPSQIQYRIRSVLANGVERAPLGRRAALAVMFALIAMVPLAAMQSGSEDEMVYNSRYRTPASHIPTGSFLYP